MNFKLVIDAGHGGYDWGLRTGNTYNKGYNNCLEKDINLEIANRLAWFCSRHNFPYIMTRWGDRFISLPERCTRANSSNAFLFLSIHCNYATSKTWKGIETFYCSNSGKSWAEKCQKLLCSLNFTKDRGVKKDDFYVLKNTKMTAILVELGFLSNPEDCKFLNNENNQNNIAISLFELVRNL